MSQLERDMLEAVALEHRARQRLLVLLRQWDDGVGDWKVCHAAEKRWQELRVRRETVATEYVAELDRLRGAA